jgi:hypothetical protein
MVASATNRRGRKGFENRIMAVTTIVNPILIKMALTLRLTLPGMSPGAFKKAPTTRAGAYSKYPKKYIMAKGVVIPTPSRIPRSKLELFKNNSSCLSISFKQFYNLIVKLG